MHTGIVATNSLVQFCIANMCNELNVGHSLRLFTNNYIPGPNSGVLDFQEASFPGYARWNLNGVFPPQVKVEEGYYASVTLPHTFTCTGASAFAVFGWFIIKDFIPKLAYRFPELIPLGPGVEFEVQVTLESVAKWLLV